MASSENFYDVLTQAVAELAETGYVSAERLAYWQERLRRVAETAAGTQADLERTMRGALGQTYDRLVGQGGILKRHPGVDRFTLDRIAPRLRAELDRRVFASADLIRLNKRQRVEETLRRFSGWATSIPEGGVARPDRRAKKAEIRKPLASLPFVERRVLIDQTHKLSASVSEILATDGGAVAAVWRHVHQAGYDGRPDHEARDGRVFLLRGSWAHERGLVRPGPAGYTDDVPGPAVEPFCRCWWTWIYSLRSLPEAMVTARGRAELERARRQVEMMT